MISQITARVSFDDALMMTSLHSKSEVGMYIYNLKSQCNQKQSRQYREKWKETLKSLHCSGLIIKKAIKSDPDWPVWARRR